MPVVILHSHVMSQVLRCLSRLFRVREPFKLVHQVTWWGFQILDTSHHSLCLVKVGISSLSDSYGLPYWIGEFLTHSDARVTVIYPGGAGAGSARSIETSS